MLSGQLPVSYTSPQSPKKPAVSETIVRHNVIISTRNLLATPKISAKRFILARYCSYNTARLLLLFLSGQFYGKPAVYRGYQIICGDV